jgi:hypothetical protein
MRAAAMLCPAKLDRGSVRLVLVALLVRISYDKHFCFEISSLDRTVWRSRRDPNPAWILRRSPNHTLVRQFVRQ